MPDTFRPGDRVVGLYTNGHYLIICPHSHWHGMFEANDRCGSNYLLQPCMIRKWTPDDGPWRGPVE